MTLQNWWIFACATCLVSAIPGPNMLHVMVQSMRHGIARSVSTMIGCTLALLCLFGLSSLGMSALLSALPQLLTAIKIAGALYLIWIGIKAWRHDGAPVDIDAVDMEMGFKTPWELFRGGFLIAIVNPKAMLFAVAFFPQFVSSSLPKAPQFAVLLVTFVVIEMSWYMVYATGGRTLARFLRRAEWQRMFDRFTGGLFILFGLSLLAWRQK